MAENIPIPQYYMTHFDFNRSIRDDMCFFWLNRKQGKYKAIDVVKRMRKMKTKNKYYG